MKTLCKKTYSESWKIFVFNVSYEVYLLSHTICNNTLQWYNIMYYVNGNIWLYGYSEHHSGVINIVSASADVFLNIFYRPKVSWPGVFGFMINVRRASWKMLYR